MFARFAALLSIAALATGVVAAPGSGGYKQCGGGVTECCNQTFEGSTPFTAVSGDSLLTAVISAVGNVGLECAPITVLGLASGAQCTTQTACCDSDQYGLVNIQCTPISANAA